MSQPETTVIAYMTYDTAHRHSIYRWVIFEGTCVGSYFVSQLHGDLGWAGRESASD